MDCTELMKEGTKLGWMVLLCGSATLKVILVCGSTFLTVDYCWDWR
jgi:hypothetical protein